jgi:site-specific DNA-methyltransferase (adenine-specific)
VPPIETPQDDVGDVQPDDNDLNTPSSQRSRGRRPLSADNEDGDFRTPDWLFNLLNGEFRFTLDAAASPDNAKVALYFTREENGLTQKWTGHTVWLNCPYNRDGILAWVAKAYQESQRGTTVVCLLPAHTHAHWYHKYCQAHAEIRFIEGWVTFRGVRRHTTQVCMVAIFRPGQEKGFAGPPITRPVQGRCPSGGVNPFPDAALQSLPNGTEREAAENDTSKDCRTSGPLEEAVVTTVEEPLDKVRYYGDEPELEQAIVAVVANLPETVREHVVNDCLFISVGRRCPGRVVSHMDCHVTPETIKRRWLILLEEQTPAEQVESVIACGIAHAWRGDDYISPDCPKDCATKAAELTKEWGFTG